MPALPIVVAILGPTGSGKTDLSLVLAEQFHGEIVNCDSVAMYREFEIGTAEPVAAKPALGPVDQVAIRFTANPGEALRPLQRIASGGELSRVMLALKTALEAQDRVDLLLFDEVDSGIGGTVARAVGERLRRLAR